jgi:hypothetical protein
MAQVSELFFSVVFHAENCAVHSGNPIVSPVYLLTPPCYHLKSLNRTGKKLTDLVGNLFCASEPSVQFFAVFYTVKLHKMKNCYLESMSREISYMEYGNGRLTGLVTSYAETAF